MALVRQSLRFTQHLRSTHPMLVCSPNFTAPKPITPKFSLPRRHTSTFTNILASDVPPPVQVQSITPAGIHLTDGLILPSACIFLEGKVFLWDVPQSVADWKEAHFGVFEVVVPKPEILLLGTGMNLERVLPFLRPYLNQLGMQVDIMDTRNACSTYNLLAEEGRRVAAALLPLSTQTWKKPASP